MNKQSFNVVFNCDSTLVKIEGPTELGRRKKITEIENLTERAMRGEDSFFDVFRKRFDLYRPTLEDINWLGDEYIKNLVDGTPELVQKLKDLGGQIYIVSAGYRPAILRLAKHLGVPAHHVCAIDISFDKSGNYEDCDLDNILTTDMGTKMVLAEIAKSGPTVYVGDSVRDLDAKDVVDLFIGFGGVKVRPVVKEKAEVFIESKSILPVLDAVKKYLNLEDLSATLLEEQKNSLQV